MSDKLHASNVKAQAKQRLLRVKSAHLVLVRLDLTHMSIVLARVKFVKAVRQDPLKVNARRQALVLIVHQDGTKTRFKLALTITTIKGLDGMNHVHCVRHAHKESFVRVAVNACRVELNLTT